MQKNLYNQRLKEMIPKFEDGKDDEYDLTWYGNPYQLPKFVAPPTDPHPVKHIYRFNKPMKPIDFVDPKDYIYGAWGSNQEAADRVYETHVGRGNIIRTTETDLPQFDATPVFDNRVNHMLDGLTDEQLGRFMEAYTIAGRPLVKSLDERPHPYEQYRYMGDGSTLRSYAHTETKNNPYILYPLGYNELLAELAHPLLDLYGNHKMQEELDEIDKLNNKKGFKGFILKIFPKLFKSKKYEYDSDNDIRGGKRYDYPDGSEGETHSFFQKVLESYVNNGTVAPYGYFAKLKHGDANYGSIQRPETFELAIQIVKDYNNRYTLEFNNNKKHLKAPKSKKK